MRTPQNRDAFPFSGSGPGLIIIRGFSLPQGEPLPLHGDIRQIEYASLTLHTLMPAAFHFHGYLVFCLTFISSLFELKLRTSLASPSRTPFQRMREQ